MLKLGIITDQISQEFDDAVATVASLGAGYIEIHSLWGKTVEDLDIDEAMRAAKIARSHGLRVSNLSTTLFLMCPLEEGKEGRIRPFSNTFIAKNGDWKTHLNLLNHCVRLCEIFDTKLIRVFGFRRYMEPDQWVLRAINDRFERATELAERYGIFLALENCPHTFLGTARLTRQIVRGIGSAHLSQLWDPGNSLRSGAIPYPEEYAMTMGHLSHIHIKNYRRDPQSGMLFHTHVGEGEIDYEKIFRQLLHDSYGGVVSLETEYFTKSESRKNATRRSYHYLVDLIGRIWP